VLLALVGAGAGTATVVLLHRDHPVAGRGTPSASASASTTPTPGPTLAAASLVTAIDQPLTGAPATGYRSYSQPATGTENAGFTIDRPASWTVKRDGAYQTYLTDPAVNANLLIDLTPHTYPNDMPAEARYIEARSVPRFPGYRQIDLKALNIRGTAGSFWKFTWTDNGVSQEALDLLFVLNTSAGPQSYALYATAPASMWTALQSVFDEELRTFAPLPK
jgi:hypothetical protein